MVDAREFGALGNGIQNESPFLQKALEAAVNGILTIPDGTYRIVETLKIPSNVEIRASGGARLFHCGSTPKKRGDFLISNRNVDTGNENISINGGVWDGNFDGVNNTKNPDLFAEDAWSGSMINFQRVRNLRLENMTLVNSVVYFVRMGDVEDFHIENIRFGSEKLAFNQDGLHFQGGCRNGVVRNIRAYNGQTNDDLIALNADDSMERLENRDLHRGDIENILIEDVAAENCYTFTRMASVTHAICNITFRNIRCGCRIYAINMDAARYCRTPLFKEEEFPRGCGCIENISIENMKVYSSDEHSVHPLICAETRCRNFRVSGFERVLEKDAHPELNPTLLARNLVNTSITVTKGGQTEEYLLKEKTDVLKLGGTFDSFSIESR